VIFGYLAAGVPGAVAAVLRYVMPVRIFMTADARQPGTRMDLPDSRIACAARQLALHASSAFVANHGVRSYLFAGELAGAKGCDMVSTMTTNWCSLATSSIPVASMPIGRSWIDGAGPSPA
jgi:hypothetical protein